MVNIRFTTEHTIIQLYALSSVDAWLTINIGLLEASPYMSSSW